MASTVKRRVDRPVPRGSSAAESKRATRATPPSPSSAARGKTTSKPTTMTSTYEQAQTWIKDAGSKTAKITETEPSYGKGVFRSRKPLPTPESGNIFARKVTWGGSQLQTPRRMPTVSGAPATGARFNKATSARLIILAMGVAGVAILFNGRNYKAPKGSTVPGNLHAFAGLTIAGTIALIVNEVSPDIGIVFAVSLAFIALADAQAFTTWGEKVFGTASPNPTAGAGGIAGPGSVFDPSTGLITGPRGTYRLVPTGGGNYSIEPPTQPVGPGGGHA